MAAAKKKKVLKYDDKPLNRVGDRIYYGNLEDKYILALDITESQTIDNIETPSKVQMLLMDNTGEFGKGEVYRKGERTNLYKALDTGAWWLRTALSAQ